MNQQSLTPRLDFVYSFSKEIVFSATELRQRNFDVFNDLTFQRFADFFRCTMDFRSSGMR